MVALLNGSLSTTRVLLVKRTPSLRREEKCLYTGGGNGEPLAWLLDQQGSVFFDQGGPFKDWNSLAVLWY